ncbi:hypothetical protein Dimus_020123 [Dionaea muscipula]
MMQRFITKKYSSGTRSLHESQPDIYKDNNHKPEMALVITEYEALCGFVSIEVTTMFLDGHSNPNLKVIGLKFTLFLYGPIDCFINTSFPLHRYIFSLVCLQLLLFAMLTWRRPRLVSGLSLRIHQRHHLAMVALQLP